jgi:RNA polymerase sigma-70 factor (ECF subfamily)
VNNSDNILRTGRQPSVDSSDQNGAVEESDRQLIAAVAHGDDAALTEIYQRYGTVIFNYLLRLVRDQTVAEDLLQETFVAVWQGAGSYRRRAMAKTWMLSIAHNKAVSWLRRNHPESIDDDRELRSEEPGPESVSLINWRNDELLAALDYLSPNHRAVVELVFVHGLAYKEVAKIMDSPVGTVKSRMSYALKHLHRLLMNSDLSE